MSNIGSNLIFHKKELIYFLIPIYKVISTKPVPNIKQYIIVYYNKWLNTFSYFKTYFNVPT